MTGARVERGRSGRPGRGLSLDRIVSVPLELMDEQGIGAATRTENVATDRERQECGPSPIRRQIAEYARLPRHSASQLGSAQITHSRATCADDWQVAVMTLIAADAGVHAKRGRCKDIWPIALLDVAEQNYALWQEIRLAHAVNR